MKLKTAPFFLNSLRQLSVTFFLISLLILSTQSPLHAQTDSAEGSSSPSFSIHEFRNNGTLAGFERMDAETQVTVLVELLLNPNGYLHTNNELFIIQDRNQILDKYFYSASVAKKLEILRVGFLQSVTLSAPDEIDQKTRWLLNLTHQLTGKNQEELICESLIDYGLDKEHIGQGEDDNDEFFRNRIAASAYLFLERAQFQLLHHNCSHEGKTISIQQMLVNGNPHVIDPENSPRFPLAVKTQPPTPVKILSPAHCKASTIQYYFSDADRLFKSNNKLRYHLMAVRDDGCTILGLLEKTGSDFTYISYIGNPSIHKATLKNQGMSSIIRHVIGEHALKKP